MFEKTKTRNAGMDPSFLGDPWFSKKRGGRVKTEVEQTSPQIRWGKKTKQPLERSKTGKAKGGLFKNKTPKGKEGRKEFLFFLGEERRNWGEPSSCTFGVWSGK